MLGVSDLQNFIENNNIDGEILDMKFPTPTVEAAAEVLGVLPQQIVKSILFLINDEPILMVLNGLDKVDRRVLASEFGVGRKKVKLAKPEAVLEISGFAVGSMPPFGHLVSLKTFLDPSIMSFQEVFTGGGSGQALMKISPQEILNRSMATLLSMGGKLEEKKI